MNQLLNLLEIQHPIIQAPMLGGATTDELVMAVGHAGALGSFAGALLAPEQLFEKVSQLKRDIDSPFNVNLFLLPSTEADAKVVKESWERLKPAYARLGIHNPTQITKFSENTALQVEALIAAAPKVVSFAFGILDSDQVNRFKVNQCKVIGTATNLEEALAWQSAGADAVVAQGTEAGGHRGTFIGDFEQSSIGLFALIPQLVAALDLPVIAAGGIMTGLGIKAALTLGASACQLGTAFLTSDEARIHAGYKQRILDATITDTRLTRVFSGKYARGIVNDFMQQHRSEEHQIAAYPIQNALTAGLRKEAANQNNLELMSLWAGQGAPLARAMPAAELIDVLINEMNAHEPMNL